MHGTSPIWPCFCLKSFQKKPREEGERGRESEFFFPRHTASGKKGKKTKDVVLTHLQRLHRVVPPVPAPLESDAHRLVLARRVHAPPARVRHRPRPAHPPTAVAPDAAERADLRVADLVLDELRVVRDVGLGVVVPEGLRGLRERVARRPQPRDELREECRGGGHVGVEPGDELGVGHGLPPHRRDAVAAVVVDGALAVDLA